MTESYHPSAQAPKRIGLAVTSLCCGIVAVPAFAGHPAMGLLIGTTAFVAGILAIRQYSRGVGAGRGMAIWGLILGLICGIAGFGGLVSPTHTATTPAQTAAANQPAQMPFTAAPVTAVPAPTATTIPGDGTYLVGSEVQPGTYRTVGAKPDLFEVCSWTRLRDTSGNSGSTIGFGASNANEPMIVTIAPTDGAFRTDGCEPWVKIK